MAIEPGTGQPSGGDEHSALSDERAERNDRDQRSGWYRTVHEAGRGPDDDDFSRDGGHHGVGGNEQAGDDVEGEGHGSRVSRAASARIRTVP